MKRLVIETREDRLEAARAIARLPARSIVELREPTDGTQEQRGLLWGLLSDLAEQADWHGLMLRSDEWHDLFMAERPGLTRVRKLTGEDYLRLGLSSSRLTKAELTSIIDAVQAFGAERGVTFRYVKPLPENPHA